jgi:hypothetical protein
MSYYLGRMFDNEVFTILFRDFSSSTLEIK